MKLTDAADYLALRRIAQNPWEIVRFRKTQRPGQILVVRLLDGSSLRIVGGTQSFHVFHRCWLRDEYRVSGYSSWDCVVDLGANAGFFSRRVAGISKQVVACEPVPANIEQLELNTRDCKNVILIPKAVAARSGRLRIYRPLSPSHTGVHSAHPELNGHMSEAYDEVDCISLDELFSEIESCDLLKIDIEGHEYEVLYSTSERTLSRIKRIHGEYHDVNRDDPRTRISSLAEFLRSHGFATEIVPGPKRSNTGLFFASRS